jgi:glucose/arabinose dehydrogenase
LIGEKRLPRRFAGHIVRHQLTLPTFTICLLLFNTASFCFASWAAGFDTGTDLFAYSTDRLALLPADLRKPHKKREPEDTGNQRGKLKQDAFVRAENRLASQVDFTLKQKLTQTAGEGGIDDQFGVAVAVSGNTAVVGAYNVNVGPNMDQGLVYVFTANAGAWSEQQKLTASDGTAGDGFGVSVAIHGDTVVVGAYADDDGSDADEADRGSAYVFTRSGEVWSEQQKLTPADGAGGDLFGFAVAVNGDTALIGSPMNDEVGSEAGAAYVFTRSGATWTQQQKLFGNDSAEDDAFGVSVAIEADTTVIGALRHDVASNSNQGAAYIFARSGLSWSQQQQLAAADGTANDQFGVSVGISGSSVIVGANSKDSGTNLGQGAGYVFAGSSGAWTQQQKLIAADGAFDDAFGTSVAISGNTAVVGSSDDDLTTSNQGSIYTFSRSDETWTQEQHLSADDGAESDFFASYVAIDGLTIVAGSPQGDIGANNDQGAAYIFNATSSVTINDVSVDEVNSGTTVATFIVSLTPPNNQVVTVDYATADGTARAGNDYVAASGVITFMPGESTQLISINIHGDVLTEPDETFFLTLSNPTNTAIGDNQSTATIQDNDPGASLPLSFVETQISGITNPTAMALAPDGRIFVCQQNGALRVIKDGVLLAAPFVSLTVSSVGERGLLGVAFDPNFNNNQFVYVYYTATTPAIHNRVSRFTANGDVAVPGSELVILDLNNLSGATNHNGGAIHFGPDGKLYVAVGENANAANAQSFGNLLGKMLRINTDPANLVPTDNPYFNDPNVTGNNKAIWALGLRNPFTFGFQPGTGRLFINDVGQNAWEEVNEGLPHSNYGWPTCEGPSCSGAPPADYRAPVYVYNQTTGTPTGCAIVGGAFYNPPILQFPARHIGKYFFADLCSGFIRYIDPTITPPIPSSTQFATGISTPVDLMVGDDGSLYYLTRGSGGSVFRVQYSGGSTIAINDVTVTEANTATATANFKVILSPASSQTVTVQYATADGSAAAGSDYVNATGTIIFMPGETVQQVSVTVNGDTAFEPNETFFINLSGAANATIDDNQATGTINNDDSQLAPPTLEFTQANFEHGEGSQSVTVTVRRSGDPVPAVSVDFETNSDLTFSECSVVNGQANQRCDYLLTTGTLTFASNELQKSFTIVTFNDAFAEGIETFSIDLSNPTGTGAVVGTLGTATVTIQDDDVGAPTTNPIDTSRYFVRQNYYDFLQRVPDQSGEDFWVGQIDQLCAPGDTVCINRRRVAVSAAFFVSSEFTRSGGFVYRLYKAAFGEQTLYRPLYSQFSTDRARVVDGADLEQAKLDLANLFVQRNEFTTRYSQTTPEAFVNALLQTVQQGSGVTFNATERQNFINDVNMGGRGLMLKNLGDNAAFTEAVFNRAFVLMQYFGYLRRDPDQGGYEFWLSILNASAQNFDGMVCAFITSPEYQKRFSSVVTRTDATCQ